MPESHLFLLIIGILYIIYLAASVAMLIWPPKKINFTYGYRTTRSMKNIESWHYANKLSAKLFLATAHVGLLLSLLIYYFYLKLNLSFTLSFLSAVFISILLSILMIPIVEYRLKKHFPENTIKIK